ncbi:MAG TPA: ABC transporter permease [Candidatus Limnocylindrales bacterium]|nr:ABC transporter permease [Candidatus Limnocylindrales bacterium]
MSTATAVQRPGVRRRAVSALHARSWAQLLLLLAPPAGWFGVVYLGSLALLLVTAFWTFDQVTGTVVRTFTLDNVARLISQPTYRIVAFRTLQFAVIVTLVDMALAFPIAWYMARVASPRTRAALLIMCLLPLWASYLVRVYAWRVILSPGGPLDWTLEQLGLGPAGLYPSDVGMGIVFAYIWLPYMIVPLFAGFERIPSSLLEASADLGGHGWTTFRRVVLPLVLPALAAGSIFTFSLTLGDYITPGLVSNNQFIGNIVFELQGVAGNLPLAAAFALVPVAIMGIYLLVARRLGAFEAL